MVKEFTVPATVGEFIKMLQQYPKNAELAVFTTDIYDNGSIWEQESHKMRIQYFISEDVEKRYPLFLTFANGYTLPKEEHP